ncbi:MAG TPA: hypothetical protein VIS48_13135 [Candidatus Kryptonia bacterium]
MASDINVNRQLAGEPAVGFGEWMITLLIMVIPIVNIVMLLVWAFSQNTNESKANWAKASLVWMVIGLVGWFLIFGALLTTFMHLAR